MIKTILASLFLGTSFNVASLFAFASENADVASGAVEQVKRGFPFSYLAEAESAVGGAASTASDATGIDISAAFANQVFWLVVGLIAFLVLRKVYQVFSKLIFFVAIGVGLAVYFGFLQLA